MIKRQQRAGPRERDLDPDRGALVWGAGKGNLAAQEAGAFPHADQANGLGIVDLGFCYATPVIDHLHHQAVSTLVKIEYPNLDSLINQKRTPDPVEVYQTALGIKPEVKNAELLKNSSQIGIDLAKAGHYPNISLNGGVSSSYSGYQTSFSTSYKPGSFGSQLSRNISPSVGIGASIPIYLNRQIKTNVEIAKLNLNNAELNEFNTKDVLRKAIEQACQNVVSNQIEFEAGSEAYKAVKESYDVASEKYSQGLMSSVDFLIQKTTYISTESTFLQAKYNLIFSYKVLDFYSGQPLSFK